MLENVELSLSHFHVVFGGVALNKTLESVVGRANTIFLESHYWTALVLTSIGLIRVPLVKQGPPLKMTWLIFLEGIPFGTILCPHPPILNMYVNNCLMQR
jgi:hypothetical protein